ncbi:hypothetical protein SODALDRAFT_332166 [Sodiomyces alkalinus F11]|uniref:Uncharacterized protein n=1 Tax=Sodiomyces alkalinus (strain CBS 110278 / VKM F-3762 / F11) TaxID=1314773 RepID=A0A3N2PZU2_SODAK|nr:hypothetical protein SODALDRAFT_332166 [Sodiomyces alkalinus F11]ROT40017.1 hypothetical protein SODALDRAFT_332166 [Sodiomyces alkalinus F11]
MADPLSLVFFPSHLFFFLCSPSHHHKHIPSRPRRIFYPPLHKSKSGLLATWFAQSPPGFLCSSVPTPSPHLLFVV